MLETKYDYNIMSWLQHVGDLVVEADADSNLRNVWCTNKGYKIVFEKEYKGKNLKTLHTPHAQKVAALIEQCIACGSPYSYSFIGSNILRPNSLVVIRIVRAFYDPSLALLIASFLKNDKIEIEEETWMQTVNAVGDGLWDRNYSDDTIFVSGKWKELFGYEKDDIDNSVSSLDRLIHPDDLSKLKEDINRHVRGETDYFYNEHRKRCKDGSYKWVLSRGYLISTGKKGKPLRMLGIDMDISLMKNAEEMLQVSKETFLKAFHFSGIGKALIDLKGKWIDVNQALLNMVGYTKEEFFKKDFRSLSHPEDVKKELDLTRQIITGEINSYNIEKRYLAKNGEVIWAILNVCMVANKEEQMDFLIAQVTDISYQKHLYAELSEKTVNLESVARELHTKILQLEEVNHMVAHNLRGPAGNIEALIEGYMENEALYPLEETLIYIKESSSSLKESLNTLMQLSQLKLNRATLFEDCNLELMTAKVKSQLTNVILQKQAVLELKLQERYIYYPPAYMESILYNLISNALKYAQPDLPCKIVISSCMEDKKFIVSVKDNGLGIDMEKYGDKLFKLNQTFHKRQDSKGIGLFITKSQIESLGGSIGVISKVNEGSEFIITIKNQKH